MIKELNVKKAIETFENVDLKERFTYAKIDEQVTPGHWPHSAIAVTDNETGRKIGEYSRNYSMMKTFEPFRHWNNDAEEWEYYALISVDYTAADVMNLSTGETFSYPNSEAGFCPVEFWVPDLMDWYTFGTETEPKELPGDNEKWDIETFTTFLNRRSFGFVSGCYWGDDWSWKVRTIDLSNVSHKQLGAPKETFGYFSLSQPLNKSVSKEYFFDSDYSRIDISTAISFGMNEDVSAKDYATYNEYGTLKNLND